MASISFAWKRWAAFSLMSGVSLESVADRMASEGMDRAVAMHVCGELMESPAYAAGDWMSQRLRKLESTLDVLRALRREGSNPRSIERRSSLGRDDFLQNYYSTNTPVLLQDVAADWPALKKWSPDYFADVIGDQEVEVMAGRDANPNYERESHVHKLTMPLSAYVEKALRSSPGNDMYLVANNHLLDSAAAAPLWQDFEIDQRYLDPHPAKSSAFLWLGPEGTFTPLHHDILNVLFVQVIGSKRFILVSPLESHCLANNFGVHSDVDVRSPDPARFPRYASTDRISFVVGPGDALFIPVGWWHCVESLETSASVSFTNFVYPNKYNWTQPRIKF
jgi:ribosomal protein L16 Arg81 hydroxylase